MRCGPTVACSWTAGRRTKPVSDATQNVVNPTLNYDSGVLTFTFQRSRNTPDTHDWNFSDAPADCYYVFFPVGGGWVVNNVIFRHSTTPRISDSKFCLSK